MILVPGDTPIKPLLTTLGPEPKAIELLPKVEKPLHELIVLFTVLVLAERLTKDPLVNVIAFIASARPFKTDLGPKLIAVTARICPTMKLSAPIVTALPIAQKTLDAWALFFKTTVEREPVIKVVPA